LFYPNRFTNGLVNLHEQGFRRTANFSKHQLRRIYGIRNWLRLPLVSSFRNQQLCGKQRFSISTRLWCGVMSPVSAFYGFQSGDLYRTFSNTEKATLSPEGWLYLELRPIDLDLPPFGRCASPMAFALGLRSSISHSSFENPPPLWPYPTQLTWPLQPFDYILVGGSLGGPSTVRTSHQFPEWLGW
jgi:hypothetical protein